MTVSYTVRLPGCRPEPLAHYLKGLAVIRVLGSQLGTSAVRGYWEGDQFCIRSPLDKEGLLAFFLERYRPTPIIAPWNGGSGFWGEGAAGQALERVANTTDERFALYRETIRAARQTVHRLGLDKAPKDESKSDLLRTLRAQLPDEALDWLDAAVALTVDGPQYAPILGTGGNDGRLDFTSNFLQRLADVLPLEGKWSPAEPKRPRKGAGPSRAQSEAWLRSALFREESPQLLRAAVGQFNPGGSGGPNATAGMEGDSLVNPWEFILMIEGALVLASSVSRRMGSDSMGRAALPFTVAATVAGSGTLSAQDEANSRAEIWLPIWRHPLTWGATCQLFAEGRAELHRRQARSGLDFVRAVASLGVDRAIDQFQRFGFLERNGMAYLAVPLGRVGVKVRPQIRLVDELDGWLRQASVDEGPHSLQRSLHNVEQAIWSYAEREERGALLDLLIAAAEAEMIIAQSPNLQVKVPPIRPLSPEWLTATDDGTTEFAIAASLAAIDGDEIGPLRYHWLPATAEKGKARWLDPTNRDVNLINLLPAMQTMLERRLLIQEQKGLPYIPIKSSRPLAMRYVHAFLEGRTDDRRIAQLLPALALINWRKAEGPARYDGGTPPLLNRAYALLKPLFWPGKLSGRQLPAQRIALKGQPGILSRLRSGDLKSPVDLAVRRLLSVGLTPIGFDGRVMADLKPPAGSAQRLAAALLLPLHSPQPLFNLILPETNDHQRGRDLA